MIHTISEKNRQGKNAQMLNYFNLSGLNSPPLAANGPYKIESF